MSRTKRTGIVITSVAGIIAIMSACSASPSQTTGADDCTPEHEFSTVAEGVLTVAATDAPPASSTANDEFTGVEADLLKDFAKANCLEVAYMPVSFAAAIPAVESGRADVATGGFYRTAQRAEVVALSDPVYLDMLAAVSTDEVSTVEEAEGQKVGTVDGYMWTADAQALFGSDLTVYPSSVEMRADLNAGRISVALDSFGLATSLYADDEGIKVLILPADDRIAATSEPAQIGFPLTKSNASMLEALNDRIAGWVEDSTIETVLEDNGLDASLADVGEPRLL